MADMLFMRLQGDNFAGEEPIGDSKDLIRILSYSHNISTPISALRPNVGDDARNRRGPCEHGLFQVTKALDKTSSKLFSACCNGVMFKNAAIFLCSQDQNSMTKTSEMNPFFTINLAEAIIADYSYKCEGQWPLEFLSFHYTSIGWDLDWIDPDPSNLTATLTQLSDVGWDGTKDKEASISSSSVKWESSGLIPKLPPNV